MFAKLAANLFMADTMMGARASLLPLLGASQRNLRNALGPRAGGFQVCQPASQRHASIFSPIPGSARGPVVASAAATNSAEALPEAGGERIIETELRLEAEQSYLSYAMSVIVGRALPDVRDGLKPVHRRILYAMHELGLHHSKPFRKCARVVGEVLGKFHPHGDTAVYDALVRMAQEFSMRAPLVDGHGNFGSLDDDPPAAMRYTECRLQSMTTAMLLADLDSDTVEFLPNFDASVMEPSVLPARVPNLLVNGSSGIAVGIATKIPPHNLREVVAGLKALIDNPDITVRELMKHIPAPDFPTGGEIVLSDGVRDAYADGRGSITVRAKLHIEDGAASKKKLSAKPLIVITELPYQTNKAALVEQIAKLVDGGTLTGVSDIRDESDRDGMRVVVEVKRGASADVVLNQLVKHTTVQTRFSCNMVALVGGLPRTLNLKDFLTEFLTFRSQVVERRAQFDLSKASKRLHLVDGFLIAMADLDNVVAAIRQAPDVVAATAALQSTFQLSKEQAEGVLGLTLRRLTSLEKEKLLDEQATLQTRIADISDLLEKKDRVLNVVVAEADEIASKHGNPRRTAIVTDGGVELREEDIIPNSPSVVVYSRKGYIKRMSADTFAVQGVRGTGKAAARLKEEDSLEDVTSVHDHDHLLFLTTEGQAYGLRAYEIPEATRTAIGTAITQVLPIARTSAIAAMLPVSEFAKDLHLVMLTAHGQMKRTPLSQFSKINNRGIVAMTLREGDAVQFVGICSAADSILITSSSGMALHFPADKIRPQGRAGLGMKTMSPDCGHLVGMSVLPPGIAPQADESSEEEEEDMHADAGPKDEEPVPDSGDTGPWLLLLTKKGLGKRVLVSSFRRQGRIGKGVRAVRLNEGDSLATAILASAQGDSGGETVQEDVLISTANGMLLRVAVKNISVFSRTAKGHRVVKLKEGDEVGTVTIISE